MVDRFVIFYILCAVAVVVPSIAEEKCDHAASDIGFLEVEEEDALLIHLKQGQRGFRSVTPSSCQRSNESIYLEHLDHGGDDCWWNCGERGGFCEYCGGHLCCAPNGEFDEGCHFEACKGTRDWEPSWHGLSRRRHHYCARFRPPVVDLTAAEAQVEVPLVTTETEGASRQSQFRLSTALQARQITGTIAGLVKWFDFIPAVGGYVAQFRLPRGDYEAKSCNLAEVLPVMDESVHLDMIGAGFSYYLAKSEPKHPSINMGGCKCISYENSSLTACAGDVLADALRVLEPIGRKLLSHGEYHYLSFGGMLATFNHGSNQNYNSIVDGLNWMEVYSLKQKSFEVISNLTLMKEVIASRAFIMTRANFRTEPDDWVITVTDQTRGKEVMDQEFLTSLDGVEDLSAIVKFETDGSYILETFGKKPLTAEQLHVLYKKNYSPHLCAKEYRKCRFVDFFLGGDDIDDSRGIFGYSFDLNGHVVRSNQVQSWWDIRDTFGTRFFGEHFPPSVATARMYQFELCVKGFDVSAMTSYYHKGYQRWPEAERLTHSATFRRGFCRPLNCYTWVHVNFLGQQAEVVKLWDHVIELFNMTEVYVHYGKERLGKAPSKELLYI